MIGWCHRFSGYELGQTPGDYEGWIDWCAEVHGLMKNWKQLLTKTTTTKAKCRFIFMNRLEQRRIQYRIRILIC